MINLDDRYHSYLSNPNKGLTIDGVKEGVTGYGWHCDGNELKGHYVTTDNYKLFYNMSGEYVEKQPIKHLVTI